MPFSGEQLLRSTAVDRAAAGIRIALGILFVMTGFMKLLVPTLGTAFAGQLAASGMPLQSLSRWAVPLVEVAVGLALLAGFYTRLATMLVFNIMIVATYVHLVVDDPTLFPLQPEQPIVPIAVMIVAGYLLIRGGGSGSLDLKASAGTSTVRERQP